MKAGERREGRIKRRKGGKKGRREGREVNLLQHLLLMNHLVLDGSKIGFYSFSVRVQGEKEENESISK